MICSKCDEFIYVYYSTENYNICNDCYSRLHSKTTINQHIIDFLDYYSNLSAPEYAVMISGEWGCGKTWFMKGIMKRWHTSGIKYVYVSLYGIKSFDEVESAMFQALHPWLSSKSVALAAKILGGAVKGTLRIDLSAENKKDINVQAQVPSIGLPSYLTNTENCILVFDDIERCFIDPAALFGYFNYFVEHQGYKCVLICNEIDMLNKENKNNTANEKSTFINIKEKLVGKTFLCETDVNAAMAYFIELVDNKVKNILEDNEDVVLEVYNNAGYNNLRHLKQGFFDFARFYQFLPDFSIKNRYFIRDILRYFMIFAIETKAGIKISGEIDRSKRSFYKSIGSFYNAGESEPASIFKKYKNVSFMDTIISNSLWTQFFDKSLVDKNKLLESISMSAYFKSETRPDWAKLWHWRDLEVDQFDSLVSSVEAELADKRYTTLGALKHAVGLLSAFTSMELIERNITDIIALGKQHVLHLKAEKRIHQEASSLKNTAAYGLGFYGLDIPEVKDFFTFCDIKETECKTEAIAEAGRSIVEMIATDVQRFARSICVCNSEDQIYCDVPIFAYADVEAFGKAYFSASVQDKDLINSGIANRYGYALARTALRAEEQWLVSLKNFLQNSASKLDKITRIRVKELVESIDAAIVWLQQD